MIDRLVVINDVSIARGGATGVALGSVRAVRARGLPVSLITGDRGENPDLRDLGVEIVSMGQALLLDAAKGEALVRGLYNVRTIEVVGDWVARNDTAGTIYHVHTWSKILSPSLFQVLRSVSDRLIVSAHDFFLVCPNGGYVLYRTGRVCERRPMSPACVFAACDRRSYGHKLWRVARQAVRSMAIDLRRTPPLVLAVHENMRAGLERGGLPSRAIKVLRNPVEAFTESRIRAERNDHAVFIGRLDYEKGADLAAKAARLAGVKLRVIGDGPMLEPLKREYPEVVWEGRRSRAEIGALVASARALVMPSRYPEPFGLAAAEALWSGLPVILNETAMMADDIVDRGAGLACDVHEDGALASVLRRLFANDADTERMSRNAFEATRDLGHTPAAWTDALTAIYEDLASASVPRRPASFGSPTVERNRRMLPHDARQFTRSSEHR